MLKFRIDQLAGGIVVAAGVGLLVMNLTQSRLSAASAQPLPTAKVQLVGINPVPVFTDLLSGQATSAAEVESEMARFTATLSAQTIFVMDVPSASTLLSKNAEARHSPASTTKLLSALVTLDTYAPNQVLTVRDESLTEGTVIGLQTGENMTVRDLLAGLLVHSGNDAAMVLANNHPQGYQGFVAAMNYKAAELGLEHSTFTNPAGLDDSNHFSTARDLAIISREVMKNPVLLPIVKTKEILISDTTLALSHPLTNTNELLGIEPGVIGVKTGTTEAAGEVLITQLQRQGREILVVIMGSQDRYFDTKQIYNWIFSHYQWQTVDSGTLK